jgi:hypothetical protein
MLFNRAEKQNVVFRRQIYELFVFTVVKKRIKRRLFWNIKVRNVYMHDIETEMMLVKILLWVT